MKTIKEGVSKEDIIAGGIKSEVEGALVDFKKNFYNILSRRPAPMTCDAAGNNEISDEVFSRIGGECFDMAIDFLKNFIDELECTRSNSPRGEGGENDIKKTTKIVMTAGPLPTPLDNFNY